MLVKLRCPVCGQQRHRRVSQGLDFTTVAIADLPCSGECREKFKWRNIQSSSIPVRCPVCRDIHLVGKDLRTIGDPVELCDLPCSEICFQAFQQTGDSVVRRLVGIIYLMTGHGAKLPSGGDQVLRDANDYLGHA